jgi:hypothetical protein
MLCENRKIGLRSRRSLLAIWPHWLLKEFQLKTILMMFEGQLVRFMQVLSNVFWIVLGFQLIFVITSLAGMETVFPDKQEKAQQEIDTVIGHNRLPEFSDRNSLPYLDALFQEVLR